MRRLSYLLAILFCTVSAMAQTADVRHNSNLRQSPDGSSTILASVPAGAQVTMLSSKQRLGYYHVKTQDGATGWLWAKNLSTTSGAPSNQPIAPAAPPPPPATAAVVSELQGARVTAVPKPLVIAGQTVCAATGNATNAKMKALDTEKNRTDVPNTYIPLAWDAFVDGSLPSASPSNVEGAPVSVIGYLSHQIKVQTSSSGESANCGLHQPSEVDWHMYLTKNTKEAIAKAVIVETTPRTRPLHSWNETALVQLVNTNTQVRISGWLMYDAQHVGEIGSARATVWEVHPITRIEVSDGHGGWKDVEQH